MDLMAPNSEWACERAAVIQPKSLKIKTYGGWLSTMTLGRPKKVDSVTSHKNKALLTWQVLSRTRHKKEYHPYH